MDVTHGTAVTVRPIDEEDLDLVSSNVASGIPEKHRARLAMQQRGEAVYLIAWHQGLPVGHLLLKWTGPPHEPMASSLRDCPHIEDLFVNRDRRSRGIGSQLLHAAEDQARSRGCTCIGLGVGIGNRRARSLYERRGYRDSGLGSYRHRAVQTEDGAQQVREETDIYMVKNL